MNNIDKIGNLFHKDKPTNTLISGSSNCFNIQSHLFPQQNSKIQQPLSQSTVQLNINTLKFPKQNSELFNLSCIDAQSLPEEASSSHLDLNASDDLFIKTLFQNKNASRSKHILPHLRWETPAFANWNGLQNFNIQLITQNFEVINSPQVDIWSIIPLVWDIFTLWHSAFEHQLQTIFVIAKVNKTDNCLFANSQNLF